MCEFALNSFISDQNKRVDKVNIVKSQQLLHLSEENTQKFIVLLPAIDISMKKNLKDLAKMVFRRKHMAEKHLLEKNKV